MIDFAKPQVICGFPGVGKSALYQKTFGAWHDRLCDTDANTFHGDGYVFPQSYMTHIQNLLLNDYVVFAPTDRVVRDALFDHGIPFTIVYPASIHQKDEYLQRYIDRGSSEAFVNLMRDKWDEFYLDVSNDHRGEHLLLNAGFYLSNLVK